MNPSHKNRIPASPYDWLIHARSDIKLARLGIDQDVLKDMSVRQRLQWLEETNIFINKTIGFKKRAITYARFEGLE